MSEAFGVSIIPERFSLFNPFMYLHRKRQVTICVLSASTARMTTVTGIFLDFFVWEISLRSLRDSRTLSQRHAS